MGMIPVETTGMILPKKTPLRVIHDHPASIHHRTMPIGLAGNYPPGVASHLPAIPAATRTSANDKHSIQNNRPGHCHRNKVRSIHGRHPAIPRRKITSMSSSSATDDTSRTRRPGNKPANQAPRTTNTSSSNATSDTANPLSEATANSAEMRLTSPFVLLANPAIFTTIRTIPTSASRRAASPAHILPTRLTCL